MALEIEKFKCLEAGNAKDAHAIIMDKSPDLVLLDWMLPAESGIAFLKRLRKDQLTENLLVIMLTAHSGEKNIVRGLQVGADDYIAKPFAPKELIARIRSLLRMKSKSL